MGNGSDINVVTDPWLKGKENYKLEDGHTVTQNLKVADLFSPGTKMWDEGRINTMFSERDARAILATKIPQHDTKDRFAWVSSTNDHYTVKSGYQTWQDLYNSHPNNTILNGWKRL